MTIKLSGYSDDLISIDGDISEEFMYPNGDETFIVLSDGTALRVQYDGSGVWRFNLVTKGEGSEVTIVQAPENDEDNYSDVVTVETNLRVAPIAWVALATQLVKK